MHTVNYTTSDSRLTRCCSSLRRSVAACLPTVAIRAAAATGNAYWQPTLASPHWTQTS